MTADRHNGPARGLRTGHPASRALPGSQRLAYDGRVADRPLKKLPCVDATALPGDWIATPDGLIPATDENLARAARMGGLIFASRQRSTARALRLPSQAP